MNSLDKWLGLAILVVIVVVAILPLIWNATARAAANGDADANSLLLVGLIGFVFVAAFIYFIVRKSMGGNK